MLLVLHLGVSRRYRLRVICRDVRQLRILVVIILLWLGSYYLVIIEVLATACHWAM